MGPARVVFFCLLCVLLVAPAYADCVELTFDTPGRLPTDDGWSFAGTADPNAVASVANGLLTLNTLNTGAAAFFSLDGALDSTRPFEVEMRARLFSVTGSYGFDVEVSDSQYDFEFGLLTFGADLPPPRVFILLPTDAGTFHTYRIVGSVPAARYELYVDGEHIVSRTIQPGGDPGNRVAFGDGTFGADSHAQIDYFRFCQPDLERIVRIAVRSVIHSRAQGKIAVTLFGSSELPVSAIQVQSLTFGNAGIAMRNNGTPHASVEQADGDGIPDLVLHFDVMPLQPGSRTVTLRGTTHTGEPLVGTTEVTVR